MMLPKRTLRQRRYSALTYRKLLERTAVLYGRELNRLNSRTR
jgi:hypothetical protein